ncbi:MAG: 4-hydroxybenzoate octaprenyltransferase [Sphingomonadales bacterium]|nr:4-hydroxybenzoate octaprenyltransferase [Sphingomonadales bacterium]NCO49557.1 4-hydroxybenzoate octaprenyltransferase [Sphingomonadales bacterium]NCP25785.1 4-hydroxybenzoate octaprenyltransferase [Sphingomonadales bacterium]NCP42840.1 4-hydroxybenzoate octaprenyltransferase [Sphingomonadales bacterium]NCP48184.1 4-hydroxybenzoate octaprenyltransferase [Sphingomonadales bacterium]
MSSDFQNIVPDSEHKGIVGLLPAASRPYALLARFDRPIGWWLLYWPCAWGIALAGGAIERWDLLLWLLLGSIAMRGAGCVYNDIVDRDLDRQVERTRSRPLASGAVSLKAAWIWLTILCLIGLTVWWQINGIAKLVALGSLALVAAYPFMKRITWWPQAWLGLVFSWGALVGWLAIDPAFHWAMALLYFGSIFWVIGYDTIYALQDREDDALVGIRSSALRLGENVRFGVLTFYLIALVSWGAAFWMLRPQWLGLAALAPVGLHLLWQVVTLKSSDGDDALAKFRSNRFAGLLIFLACLVLGQAG